MLLAGNLPLFHIFPLTLLNAAGPHLLQCVELCHPTAGETTSVWRCCVKVDPNAGHAHSAEGKSRWRWSREMMVEDRWRSAAGQNRAKGCEYSCLEADVKHHSGPENDLAQKSCIAGGEIQPGWGADWQQVSRFSRCERLAGIQEQERYAHKQTACLHLDYINQGLLLAGWKYQSHHIF